MRARSDAGVANRDLSVNQVATSTNPYQPQDWSSHAPHPQNAPAPCAWLGTRLL